MATYLETARNKLRALTAANAISLIGEGFQRLAEDIDTKMASWWEGTHAARPAAGQPNRLYRETDTGILYHDTGSAWEPIGHAPGDLKFTAAVALGEGWLNADGSAVSRSTYANLFAAIGTSNGAGNGTTTFNLPDYRERVPVGKGGGGFPLGATGGEQSHTLTPGQTALKSHVHGFGATVLTGPSSVAGGGGTGVIASSTITQTGAPFPTAESNGEAHNNMQPYAVCNVWIKT